MILVTGGCGFIGSHFCKALRQKGEEHRIIDDLSRGHRQAAGSSELFVSDIAQVPEEAWAGVDTIVHFAGRIEVGASVKDPLEFWHVNVSKTVALLQQMESRGVEQMVFSSTAAVYGEPEQTPIPESADLAPVNPYGETKAAVERLLEGLSIRSICLRYFNAAGADPEGELGEDHRPETHLIPLAIDAALGRRDPLTIFGDDYPTTDGTCIRDYIHVSDLAEAHLAAVRHLRSGGESLCLNAGTGRGHSVKEVISAVTEAVGRPVPHTVGPRREGDPAELVAQAEAIGQKLDWRPQRSDLSRLVADAAAWRTRNPSGYA